MDPNKLKYYFVAFGASIYGYIQMRKVITIGGKHFYGKYHGFLLSTIVQETENHIYPIAHSVVDKENDTSLSFFFEKMKAFMDDELDLCIISNQYRSTTNEIAKHYSHALHKASRMKYLENYHYSTYLHVYFNATNAYNLEKFTDHFTKFKDNYPEVETFIEHNIGLDKWRRANFLVEKFNVMDINISEYLNSILWDERDYPLATVFTLITRGSPKNLESIIQR